MSIYNDVAPEEDESHQIISSYFLGPKAENYEFFKKNIMEILDGQKDARLDYFPRDGVCLSHLYVSVCTGQNVWLTFCVRNLFRKNVKHQQHIVLLLEK